VESDGITRRNLRFKTLKGSNMPEERWITALMPANFQNRLDHHLRYPGNPELAFTTAKFGLGCVKCGAATPLKACENCGNQSYELGGSQNAVGLFCFRCRQGFTTWTCACGCKNPINCETFLRRASASGGGCFTVFIACLSLLFGVLYIYASA
jgi:hypothetical protein